MGKLVSEQKLLWHLTAIDNLENILRDGLLSRKRLITANFENIADPEIIQKRHQLGFLD
jgi:hypothetical protein